MFEFGRELRRLFSGARAQFPNKDGLTGGDGALLELLDLKMLKAEAKGADVAAGRIGARDRARRLLEAAVVWRELARPPAAPRRCARPPPTPSAPPRPSPAPIASRAGPARG